MGLFDKKFCDVCGEKIGMLGNRKLEDGNICKDCAKKLSPWFDDRRHSTLEEIKSQLQMREENRSLVSSFRPGRVIRSDRYNLYIDERQQEPLREQPLQEMLLKAHGYASHAEQPMPADFVKAVVVQENRSEN